MNKKQKQAIFDAVTTHLLTQMEESYSDGQCSYRSNVKNDKGQYLRCAIGALIPNNLYRVGMEGHKASENVIKYPTLKEHFKVKSAHDMKFLDDLQHIHDYHTPAGWKNKLQSYAIDNGLKFNEVL